MAVSNVPKTKSVRERVGEEQWQARVELAAAYRLVAQHGWTNLVNNHISLRVPGAEDEFLINPHGLLYEQITASSLVRIDVDGNILDETPYKVNRAGFVIHSAIHMARKDLHCVLHTHTMPGQAVSALDCGLLPLNQAAMRFYNRIGYHDFEGIATDVDERERIVADLGPHQCLIMRNHGLLSSGADCGEAFHLMYHLVRSCETQLLVLGSGQPYSVPPAEICEKTAGQYWSSGRRLGQLDWPALMQRLDATDPSYRD
ncbi:MAG: class II aldolase/adducin family protein [Betaproteobacteria bacterium]|nr:class II aldolase/adducin family protein [Betaproteobacteria bacterium]